MKRKNGMILYGGILILAAAFAADLLTGSSGIPPSDVWKALAGGEVLEQTRLIVTDIRLCKTLTALLSGTAVSVSGLLMQTLFRNPLAGPFVLGISSGASLGVALFLLGAPLLARYFGRLAPISAGGATTADTTLPVITKFCGKEFVVVSIVHGVMVDLSVPFLVTFFCSL